MNPRSRILLARFQPLIALTAIVLGLSLTAGSWQNLWTTWQSFFTLHNLSTVLQQISINLCLSIGMTLVILSGGIDLSVGSVLAVTGALSAGLLRNGLDLPRFGVHLQFTPGGAILSGIVLGLALGWVNGFNVTKLRVPPFVATLGMLSIARGLTLLYSGGKVINDLGPVFAFIGAGSWLWVPTLIWITAALVAVFHLISCSTRFGRYLYAIGGSGSAARFAGVEVNRVKRRVYTLAGGLAGVAGVLQSARLVSA